MAFGVLFLSLDIFKTCPLYHKEHSLFYYRVIFRYWITFVCLFAVGGYFGLQTFLITCHVLGDINMKQLENESFELDYGQCGIQMIKKKFRVKMKENAFFKTKMQFKCTVSF